MRAIVIGGSGQIGGWLLQSLIAAGDDAIGTFASVPTPGLLPLDASDQLSAAEWVRSRNPDVVFYPAGFTWVDGCQRDPAKAFAANRDEPLNLARAASQVGAKFVYFSTDYVFDGQSGPNSEADQPKPLSIYGEAKLAAEHQLIDELRDQALIARTSWVYGPERQGKNFAYQLVKTLKAGKPLVCPSDQVSSPSYGPDVARATLSLLRAGIHGLIHVAGPEVMDRVTFAKAIAVAFGLAPELIESQSTAELAQEAPRPLQGGLTTPRLDAFKPNLMRPLNESLADFRTCVRSDQNWRNPLENGD